MALKKYNDVPLDKGLFDGLHSSDIPAGGFSELKGYELEYGWPIGERGRLKLTGSEVWSGEPFKEGLDWHRPGDAYVWELAVANGGIFDGGGGESHESYVNLISQLSCGGTAAFTNGSKIVTGTGTKWLHSVRPGDFMWQNPPDGISSATEVDTVDSQTQVTLKSNYPGIGGVTAGYHCWRKLVGDTISYALTCDGRLYIADGVGPLHWFGDDGRGTDVFREAGLMKPTTYPTAVTAAGGALSEGDYSWLVAFGDARGNVGPAIRTKAQAVILNHKCTLDALPEPPAWATEYHVFRPIVDTDLAYSIVWDVTVKLASIGAFGGGETVLTLDTEEGDLTVDQHIHRRLVFADSGNAYIVSDNAAGTVTVTGDASGETGTAWITIAGGFDIDAAKADKIVDLTADADLNTSFMAPWGITNTTRSYNEPPPLGLQYVTAFDGGSRLVAYKEGTCIETWFSGRPPVASKTGQPDFGGRLEFDYWPHFQEAGPANGDEITGYFELGRYLHVAKLRSFWEVHRDSDDVAAWRIGPVPQAEHTGIVAPKSIVVHNGVMWGLGFESDRIELVRFDGHSAIGFLRPRLNGTLDTITHPETATAAVFEGKLFFSVDTDDDSENDLTICLRFKGLSVTKQPWGCGVFIEREGEDADSLALLCGSPEVDESHVYQVLGSAADAGGDISRVAATGEISGEQADEEILWSHMLLEVVVETP